MSERYTRKYTMPEMLYIEGAPVLICAGALLKDNKLDRNVLQLKLKNIHDKIIKKAKVIVLLLDSKGQPTNEYKVYEYKHRNAARGEYFGHQSAIEFPYPCDSKFGIKVLSVTYDDKEMWKGPDQLWEPFPLNGAIKKVFNNDADLIRQYKIKYGEDGEAVFDKNDKMWQCICGEYNLLGDSKCYNCDRAMDEMPVFDINELQKECTERLAEEKKEREERERQKRKARNKTIAIVTIIAILVAAAGIAIGISISNAKKADAYEAAITMLEEGDYSEAFDAFEELGDYKDSQKYVKNEDKYTSYYYALHCLEYKEYDEAIEIFTELGDFEDSAKMLQKAKDEGVAMCEEYVEDYFDYGSDLALTKMEDCREALTKPSEEQLKKEIVGSWATYWDMNEPMTMKYNSDGTAEFQKEEKDPYEMKWAIKGGAFVYMGPEDTNGLDFEVRMLDNDTLLLFDFDGNSLIHVLFRK